MVLKQKGKPERARNRSVELPVNSATIANSLMARLKNLKIFASVTVEVTAKMIVNVVKASVEETVEETVPAKKANCEDKYPTANTATTKP